MDEDEFWDDLRRPKESDSLPLTEIDEIIVRPEVTASSIASMYTSHPLFKPSPSVEDIVIEFSLANELGYTEGSAIEGIIHWSRDGEPVALEKAISCLTKLLENESPKHEWTEDELVPKAKEEVNPLFKDNNAFADQVVEKYMIEIEEDECS
jgi:hypothetical protein